MAIPDGKPATDFSAMNREWVRAVAEEAAESGGSGIPAPDNPSNGDVLTYDSTDGKWKAEAPSDELPPATTSDYGKVLKLQKVPATMDTIVPQQTVTITELAEAAPLTNVNTSLVAEGVECIITINDTTETGVIDGDWYLITDTMTIDFNVPEIEITTPGTYTVTVTTPATYKAEPAWLAESGGGGVFLITDTNGTLNKTYTEIYTAFISGLVCIIHREETDTDYSNIGDYHVLGINIMTEGVDTDYIVSTIGTLNTHHYYFASSASDYPSHGSSGGGGDG